MRPHAKFGVVLAVTACGRLGFEPIPGQADAPESIDALLTASEGCALYLQMDEPAWTGAAGEVIDACAGNHGQAVGVATTVDGGVRGRAGAFDTSACVIVPDAPSLDATTGVTMSAWILPTTLGGSAAYGVISKRDHQQTEHAYALFVFTGSRPNVDIDKTDTRLQGTEPVVLDQWQQLTAVFDGLAPVDQRIRLYLDGTLIGVGDELTPSIPDYTSDLRIGCQASGALGQHFKGLLDEVIVWTRALNEAEVTAWYLASRPSAPDKP